jgi:hypothetical protein
MEVLVPLVIVTIGIGLLFVFLRRPQVVTPPSNVAAPTPDASKMTLRGDDLQEILKELKDTPPDGVKRVAIMKGDTQIGWTVTRRVKHTSFDTGDLSDLEGKARELLEQLAPGSVARNAPPEADLQYPGSSRVVDSFNIQSSAADGTGESRDVYKTTFATEADSAGVLAWYRDWLLGHGWQLSPAAATSPASSQEYSRTSEHFRLAVADPAALAPVLAVPIPVGTKTIYEVEYSNTSTLSTTH